MPTKLESRDKNGDENVIEFANARILFSYSRPVAYITKSGSAARTREFMSNTTERHIKRFLLGRPFLSVSQEHFDKIALQIEAGIEPE